MPDTQVAGSDIHRLDGRRMPAAVPTPSRVPLTLWDFAVYQIIDSEAAGGRTSDPGGGPRGASGACRQTAISLSSLRAFSGL